MVLQPAKAPLDSIVISDTNTLSHPPTIGSNSHAGNDLKAWYALNFRDFQLDLSARMHLAMIEGA